MNSKKTWKDKTGQHFGRLFVIKLLKTSKHGHSLYLCQCECGEMLNVKSSRLGYGGEREKVCCNNCSGSTRLHEVLTGKRFNGWSIGKFIKREVAGISGRRRTDFYYECTCDCGTKVIRSTRNITANKSKSCGNCMMNNKEKAG